MDFVDDDESQPFSQSFVFETAEEGESQSQHINFVDDGTFENSSMPGAGLPPTQDGMTYPDETLMTGTASQSMTGTEDRHASMPSFDATDHAADPLGEEPALASTEDGPLTFVEDYPGELEAVAPAELPSWKCEFCNIHTPAAVVKCVKTGKWFCNHKQPGLPASCIVYHLVKSGNNQVMLHKESPLGEITLECFLTGVTNAFQLGFVPVQEDLVVLLARDVDVANTEYDWDLTKWAPLVQEKEFVSWLVKKPSEAEALRARSLNVGVVNKLEELWRTTPSATIQDVLDQSEGGSLTTSDSDPAPVQERYEDAYQFQNIMGPLVKLEADYDKQMREQQTQSNITLRWGLGLNKKRCALKLAKNRRLNINPPLTPPAKPAQCTHAGRCLLVQDRNVHLWQPRRCPEDHPRRRAALAASRRRIPSGMGGQRYGRAALRLRRGRLGAQSRWRRCADHDDEWLHRRFRVEVHRVRPHADGAQDVCCRRDLGEWLHLPSPPGARGPRASR